MSTEIVDFAVEDFKEEFAKVAALVQEQLNTHRNRAEPLEEPLQELDQFIGNWTGILKAKAIAGDESEKVELQFLCFFLDAFLAKALPNLTNEAILMTNIALPILREFSDSISAALSSIQVSLSVNDYASLYTWYKSLGVAYLNTIDALNAAFH